MFPLSKEPIAYQLTIHRCNYEASRPKGSFVRDFNECMFGTDYQRQYNQQMSLLIEHYGLVSIQQFISEFKLEDTA
jgi:hypothetical protein